jgi:hypothetical protein
MSTAANAGFVRDMTAGKGYLALAALILGVMGLYHGPRAYRKILRFLTFPLRKLGLFKRL